MHDWRDAELAELGRSLRKLTHDLRNTTVSSRVMSDRLRRHDDPLVRQSAELIAWSLDRAVRMCQQTLDVGSAREPSPRRERFTLADLTTELNVAMGPCEVAQVQLETPGADAVEMYADFDQVFRILMNLIRNALAAGSRHVRLVGSLQGGCTVIDCTDDGPRDEVQRRLFVEKSASDGAGAGLGLAVSWKLARSDGGDLTLLETSSAGTVFRLGLPKRDIDLASANPTPP